MRDRLLVEEHVFDMAGLVESAEALGEAFDLAFRKNEAMLRRLPGNFLMFVEFEEGGGVGELAALARGAAGLDLAELVEGPLELAGKALAVEAEVGDEAMGVNDVECDFSIGRDGRGGAGEDLGFEQRDTVEAPRGVGKFLDELRLGGSGGLVFVEEAAAVVVIGGAVLGGEDGGRGGEAVAQGVERGTLFAGGVRGPVECWELARLMAGRLERGRALGDVIGVGCMRLG
ncbi:MAG TPA: hypothetical protein VME17_06000 [Bryobacteraceae bacterium]|nr:hypothetical protein [Bryobacteraceae bacterium]